MKVYVLIQDGRSGTTVNGIKSIEFFYEDSSWTDNVIYVDFKLRKRAA